MIKIAICEDTESFADALKKKIEYWAVSSGFNVAIKMFNDGTPLLHNIRDNSAFDLIFMDVEMEGMDGLEAAAKIRKTDFITSIIFVSQYEDYYRDAYEVHPFHFLSKPVSQARLNEVMDSFVKMKIQDVETFSFQMNKRKITVHLSDVLYFASELRLIHVIGKQVNYHFYGKLNEVQKILEEKNGRFLRIHQSYLVNMKYIMEYHYADVLLVNGESLLISRDCRKEVGKIHRTLLERQ